MNTDSIYKIEDFSKKKEATLAFNMEQNTDLWLALMSEYTLSNGQKAEFLKFGILDELDEWNELVKQVTSTRFQGLKDIIRTKRTRWHLSIRNLLADPVHVGILETYLRSLVALKLKKINLAFGGEVKQKINRVLSFAANESFIYLRKYLEVSQALTEGKLPSGVQLEANVRRLYEEMQWENLNFLNIFLTIIIIFKSANCKEDIEFLQGYINSMLVRPQETRLSSLNTRSEEYKLGRDKLVAYQMLLGATEISFN
jgi:hypothetical protein